MEKWESDLRARLDVEIKDGAYQIGSGKWIAWTGKLGYINYLVELQRTLNDNRTVVMKGITEDNCLSYHMISIDKLKEIFKDLFKEDER